MEKHDLLQNNKISTDYNTDLAIRKEEFNIGIVSEKNTIFLL